MKASIAIFLVIINFSTFAINDSNEKKIDHFLSNIDSLYKCNTEKVHLHTDRSIYTPGEDIWFKAYLLEGTTHYPNTSSRNLHVELISSSGDIIDEKVIFIQLSCGNGDFHLGQDLPAGSYQIRAYTNFMRNFDEGLFFTKEIMILQSGSDVEVVNIPEPKIDLQFFPESGNLVAGIKSKVAVKAINEKGKGVDVKFSIYNKNNALVAKGLSQFRGMGYLYLKPKKNDFYFALIEGDKRKVKYPLPPVTPEGHTLQMLDSLSENNLALQINRSDTLVEEEKVSLLVQARGILIYNGEFILKSLQSKVHIPWHIFPEGIASIILFDKNGVPVAERLVFNSTLNKINVEIVELENEEEVDGIVRLAIQTTDHGGNPVAANLSLAVTEKLSSESQMQPGFNIFSQILLNSDLKGNIEDPDYYFTDGNPKKEQYLDLVMLTNGWKRYIWTEYTMKNCFDFPYEFEEGFNFSGVVQKPFSDKPQTSMKTTFSITEGQFYFDKTISNEKGEFSFRNIMLYDSVNVKAKSYNKNGKLSSRIEMHQEQYKSPPVKFRPQISGNIVDEFSFEDYKKMADVISQQLSLKTNKYINIEEVTVSAPKIEKAVDPIRKFHRTNHIVKVEDIPIGAIDIFQLLQSKFPGVKVNGKCPNVNVMIRGRTSLTNAGSPQDVLYLLDGIICDNKTICNIHPSNVESIEIFKGAAAAIFGSRGANGAILIYTKNGDQLKELEESNVGISTIIAKGFYRSREEYKPKYKAADYENIPKNRTTLFWIPYLVTDSQGKAEVSYLNSTKQAEYNIIIEGVGVKNGIANMVISYKTTY